MLFVAISAGRSDSNAAEDMSQEQHAVPGKNSGAALAEARTAAGEDRHRDAIRFYLEALRIDPDLESTIAVELGHQYTWAEAPDSAIIWYARHLSHHPDDMEASIGIARAMSWADDLYGAEDYYLEILPKSKKEWPYVLLGLARVTAWQEDRQTAEEIYDYLLDRFPDNTEARVGRAQILNWSGKHREARAEYQRVLRDDPGNTDAVKGLAEALFWMGRADLALGTIGEAEPSDELDRLRETIESSKRPNVSVSYLYSENTDDGVFGRTRFEGTFPVGYRIDPGAAYMHGTLKKDGFPDIDRHQFWLSLEYRFSELLAIVVKPGYELNRFDEVTVPPSTQAVSDFDLFVWDAYATLTPQDWIRLDFGSSRQTMTIPEPVFRGIDVTTFSAGLDWRMAHRVVTFWETRFSDYSDGNSRFAALHRGEWTPPARVPYPFFNRIVLIEGIDYFNFAEEASNGYFNPESYVHLYGGLRYVTDLTRRVRLRLEGRFGAERDSGAGWASVGSFDGDVGVRVVGGFYLRVGYYKSGSRVTSPDGFRSEGAFITLDYTGAR
jgi:tetratricopeptide (TPR) repeat protein